jgi:hypothetical protein
MTGLINDELKGMWKEVFVSEFKAIYRHFPGNIQRKKHENARQDSRCSGKG